jgi:hypothetical protein
LTSPNEQWRHRKWDLVFDVFAQAFHPVGSNGRRIDETPIACSSALSFGVAIGF